MRRLALFITIAAFAWLSVACGGGSSDSTTVIVAPDEIYRGDGPGEGTGFSASPFMGDSSKATSDPAGITITSPELGGPIVIILRSPEGDPVSGLNIWWWAESGILWVLTGDPSGTYRPAYYFGEPFADMKIDMQGAQREIVIGMQPSGFTGVDVAPGLLFCTEYSTSHIGLTTGDGYGVFNCTLQQLAQYRLDEYSSDTGFLKLANEVRNGSYMGSLRYSVFHDALAGQNAEMQDILDAWIAAINAYAEPGFYGSVSADTPVWVIVERVGADCATYQFTVLPDTIDDMYDLGTPDENGNDYPELAYSLLNSYSDEIMFISEGDLDHWSCELAQGESLTCDISFPADVGEFTVSVFGQYSTPENPDIEEASSDGSLSVTLPAVAFSGTYTVRVSYNGWSWLRTTYKLSSSQMFSPIEAPEMLHATVVDSDTVELAWPPALGATGYMLSRYLGGTNTPLDSFELSSSRTSFTDNYSFAEDSGYVYGIIAHRGAEGSQETLSEPVAPAAPEIANVTPTSLLINPGINTRGGELGAQDTSDLYTFAVQSGETYSFWTTGSLDTFGELFTGEYNLHTSDDNSGPDDNFLIEFIPDWSGVAYLLVSSDDTGTYTLNWRVGTHDLLPPTMVRMSSAIAHSVFIGYDNKVYSCGRNSFGELGREPEFIERPPLDDRKLDGVAMEGDYEPMLIPSLVDMEVIEVASNYFCSYVLTASGEVYSFGLNQFGLLGNGEDQGFSTYMPVQVAGLGGHKVVSIAPGEEHMLVLCEDGTVFSWGENAHGECGVGDAGVVKDIPVAVSFPAGTNVVGIAASNAQSYAWTSDGLLYAWGYNGIDNLGLGDNTDKHSPTLVTALNGEHVVDVTAGRYHAIARCDDGTFFGWSGSHYRSLSLDVPAQGVSPLARLNALDLVKVRTSYNHSIGITAEGDIYVWGDNDYHQLGSEIADTAVPQLLQMPTTVTAVDVFAGHRSCGVLFENGGFMDWGYNYYGRLGQGYTYEQEYPTKVPNLWPGAVIPFAGGAHSAALTTSPEVHSWGRNHHGQLALDSTTDCDLPQQTEIANADTLALGKDHTLVLHHDGSVSSAGDNSFGQLGLGDNNDRHTVTYVTALSGIHVDKVIAGYEHSLALAANGHLYAWGANDSGQLGITHTFDVNAPQRLLISTE
ncbi:MAG: hypothetical protein U5N86_09605 [Planctomycetota bacterium]|nr:hypothetical protein [Planctomycetota bacterium]